MTINDVVGGGASTATLTVTNSGPAGASNLTLSAISGLSGVLSITPAAPVNIAQGANQAFTISCAATSAGPTTQTLTITHNGAAPGAASPVTHQITCNGVTGPSAPVAALGAVTNPAAGPINTTGNGSVVVNVTAAGNSITAGDSSLALNCSIPAGAASFAITAGGTRTITGPAALGANAPPIGFSCTRQAAAVTGTITCAQTATPGPSPASLTAAVECPAGVVAPNPGVTPPSGSPINLVGNPGTALSQALTFTNVGGTAPYTASCAFAGPSAGYTITGSPTASIPGGGIGTITVGCTAPATAGTALPAATVNCTSAPTGLTATYTVNCRAEQAIPVPTMSASGKAMLAVLMLLVGLVGFQVYRRSA